MNRESHATAPSAPAVAATIRDRVALVRHELLRLSPHLGGPDCPRITVSELEVLLGLYDRHFLDGAVERALGPDWRERLSFRLSRRMTSAAGKTCYYPAGSGRPHPEFVIVVSAHLLFQNFRRPRSVFRVNGRPCADRLDALQCIFEHELVHLLEFLSTGHSSCTAAPFRRLARALFGHTQTRHELATTRQLAWQEHNLGVGSRVTFRHGEHCLHGVVNRITKRATVLVEDPAGARYSDGRRYRRYYVPLSCLTAGS